MNTSIPCPCCSTPLLHHFSDRREYWFCRHCWQEMPIVDRDLHQAKRKVGNAIDLSNSILVSN
ncbi:hypothetical protein I4641_06925 [Waterburya agarophytonicola K14]|uniref:Uncharacterized protein n=1 Tax=Waterburya agarophytonicola KI4 TaxID=2874699 RepID=A0A964FEI8_9CYAN|nr:hypothetical protein [Waterburya agarophytonicola]MCC0176710.1 hypothetical protein [Waterburya agarophytonicola KI4]